MARYSHELFGIPAGRATPSSALLLASSGIIGLWGIGFFSIDLPAHPSFATSSSAWDCPRRKSPVWWGSGRA